MVIIHYWIINKSAIRIFHIMIVWKFMLAKYMVMDCSLVMISLSIRVIMWLIMVVNSSIWMNFGNDIQINVMLDMLSMLVVGIIGMLLMIDTLWVVISTQMKSSTLVYWLIVVLILLDLLLLVESPLDLKCLPPTGLVMHGLGEVLYLCRIFQLCYN